MEQQSVPTSASPEVLIEAVQGSLQLKGWEEHEVRARCDSDGGLSLQEQEDAVRLSCRGDCSVRVPLGASVQIVQVHGDARIKLLEDQLTVEGVHGSLALRDIAGVDIQTVHGNLQAREISGGLRVDRVMGNAVIWDVQGEFSIEQVDGNLDLRDVDGTAQASAGGNIRVRLSSMAPGSCRFAAGGNLNCRIPNDASVSITLSSGGGTINLDLPEQRATLRQDHYEVTLQEGQTELELSAGGIIFLTAREVDWASLAEDEGPEPGVFGGDFEGISEEFTQQLTQQIDEQVQAQMSRLHEQMGRLSEMIGKAGLSEEAAERVMRSARQTTEEAAARAQEKIARAQERLARKMEAAARKAEQRAQAAERRRGSRGPSFSWPGAPQPPGAPFPPREQKEPVTEEERLMILRMLEQKKISLEQAEQLLAALEGKGG
jgi:hypothetical protein